MSISEQAIETVAIHMAGESRKPDNFYEYPYNDSDRARHREKARAALEAALPHIREQIAKEIRKAKAQGWAEGITASGINLDWQLHLLDHNPYTEES